MSDEWVTYEAAMERFGTDPSTLRRLVVSGRVRTQRENRVQMFSAGDVVRALEGPLSPPCAVRAESGREEDLTSEPPVVAEEKVELGDVEKALASDAVRDMGGERWMTYQELSDEHKILRGWLDHQVHMKKIRWRVEGAQQVYLWLDVEKALADETSRALHRVAT